jgi:hypothetical protein
MLRLAESDLLFWAEVVARERSCRVSSRPAVTRRRAGSFFAHVRGAAGADHIRWRERVMHILAPLNLA